MFEDYEDELLDLEDEEIHFDPNEDMEAYYDFDLLDILEDIDINSQDLSRTEINTILHQK